MVGVCSQAKVSRILIFGARLEAPKAKKEGQRIKGEKVALVEDSTRLSMSSINPFIYS